VNAVTEPCGCQLVDLTKLQTRPISLSIGCYRSNIYPSPFVLLLGHIADPHFTISWKVEGRVDLGSAEVSMQKMPKVAYCSDFREKKLSAVLVTSQQ